MKINLALYAGLVCLFIGADPARAQTIGASARQMAPGSLKWTAYYQGTQGQDLNFTLNNSGTCSGGGAVNPSFPCGSSGNTTATMNGGAMILQVAYQPWESLQYYALVGGGDLTLRTSSVTVRNTIAGDRPGFLSAIGVRSILIPDTIVNPAIAIDGRIGWQQYYFNELRPGSNAAEGQIDQRLQIYQYQIAVETSHRFMVPETKYTLEPYGGLKWLRSQASLKDLKTGDRAGGIQDTFAPFLGLLIPVYEHESLMAEASFVNGVQYSAGLQVHFGGVPAKTNAAQ